MVSTAPLPGVYFQTAPEAPREVLPRMDIATFVGFAAAGPVHTPVPVEDLDRFREIFGPDLALAWNREAGRLQYAHLGPTVEAFFRNGGRRCWIVRVADDPVRHEFELPGLVDADELGPAMVRARAPGAWADTLRVGTVLRRERLPLAPDSGAGALQAAIADYRLDLAIAPTELTAGDLLELRWPGSTLHLYLFVASSRAEAEVTRARGDRGFWFEEAAASPPLGSPGPASPPAPLDAALAEAVGIDSWLELTAAASPEPHPTIDRLSFELLVSDAHELAAPTSSGEGWELVAQMSELAFHPDHPRYWARLPTDRGLFRLPQGRLLEPQPPELDAFLAAADSPRFALAGPADEVADTPYLPLGMPEEALPGQAAPPIAPLAETRLERDGLASYSHRLFVDDDLTWASGQALLQEADHKYYQREQPLSGLHSLLPVDEPTLIAIPDASHPGWTRQQPEIPPPLGAPELEFVGEPVDGAFEVGWTTVAGATEYRLEQSSAPGFDPTREVARTADVTAHVELPNPCPQRLYYRVRATSASELGPWSNTHTAVLPPAVFLDCAEALVPGFRLDLVTGSPEGLAWTPDPELEGTVVPEGFELETSTTAGFESVEATVPVPATFLELPLESATLRYYRVRARAGDRVGPWSNTRFTLPSGLGDWSLEPAASPNETLLAVQRALLRFCAARRDLLALLSLPGHYRHEETVDHLRRLEPGAFEAGTATAGVVRPLRLSEGEALGFAALYHPWTTAFSEQRARGEDELALVSAPPDGIVAGAMAAQAISEGAWIAPANVELDGVLALAPNIEPARHAALLERQVNLLVQEPRGFFVWNAETLSPEAEVRPVSVRRLLILLRRLALREGNSYVFEPNHRDLRGLVRHRFERVLSGLFVRGALAGQTAEEAYRVVVDESVNTAQSIDLGQLLVELRVAPSRPMRFLTIRLVQDGSEQLSIQEL